MYGPVKNRAPVLVAALALLVAGVLAFPGCGGNPGARAYNEGLDEMQAGRYARARVLFEKSINDRPASEFNARAYNYLGVASTRMGQLERALGEFEESMRLDPGLFAPVYNLGVLMADSGQADKARHLLEQAVLLAPEDTAALRTLADLEAAAGEGKEAQTYLQGALERAPGAEDVLTDMARLHALAGDPQAAEAELMRALEKDPDYGPALYNLGVLYEQYLDQPERAANFYARFLVTAPEGEPKSQARAAYAQLARELKLQQVPGQEGGSPHLVVPEEPEATPADAGRTGYDELLGRARESAAAGRNAEAVKAALGAAAVARQRRDTRATEKALLTAVKVGPDQADAHFAWGSYCIERARYQPALQAFKRAVALQPDWVEAYIGLAEAATETGEYDAGLVALKRAVQLDPKQADALWALATLYDEHLGLAQPALKAYHDFERLFPGDPRVVRMRERLSTLEAALKPAPAPEKPPEKPTEKPAPAVTPKPAPVVPERPVARASTRRSTRTSGRRNTTAAVKAYNRATEFQERRDWDRAIYYYLQAVEHDNTFVNAYYNLGTCYRMTGELDASKEAYLNAVQLRPKMVNARYNLGLIYMEMGRHSAAVEQLRIALRLDPNHAESHYALGVLYSKNRQAVDLAKKHYRRFLELAPNDPMAPTVRTWLRLN